jgi:hypothetical protein
MAAGDRGFFSVKNEREAEALGVKKVALPARRRLSAKRAKQQKQDSSRIFPAEKAPCACSKALPNSIAALFPSSHPDNVGDIGEIALGISLHLCEVTP